jgi:glycosyltransferase involved in cell wall biosynthesis
MKHPADGAVASIIIPCWDQLEFTRFCLAALVRHTRPPWELIVIDNGSTDGTGTYLAGVQDVAPLPVIVVHNERNVGFPAAINQGLKAARGDYLVLMNNDAVVTNRLAGPAHCAGRDALEGGSNHRAHRDHGDENTARGVDDGTAR